MSGPLVSIGIPVFNEAEFIEETVRSALDQTHTAIELIIADNFSTDGTPEIIEKIAREDSRLKLIRNPQNLGAPANGRLVRDTATGQYFMWLGGHDILRPDCVESALGKYRENPQAALVYPKCDLVDEHDISQVVMSGDSEIDTRHLDMLQGPVHVARNLVKCSAIYGLFNSRLIRRIPIEPIYGGDDLMLFLAAAYGPIVAADDVGILRRHPRLDEQPEERKTRYADYRVIDREADFSRTRTAAFHLYWIRKIPHFTRWQRVRLSRQLLKIYRSRYQVRAAAAVVGALRVQTAEPEIQLPHLSEIRSS